MPDQERIVAGDVSAEVSSDRVTISVPREYQDILMRMLASLGRSPNRTASPAMNEDVADDGAYMAEIIATPMTYPPQIVEALRDFKRHHKLGTESNASRLEAMKILLAEIACAHGTPIPTLTMANIDGGNSGRSHYNSATHAIHMEGKLSIITFLHECAHAIYGHDEHMARVWSIKLFKKVYPKAFRNLRVSDGFVLSMPNALLAMPVVNGGEVQPETQGGSDGTQ